MLINLDLAGADFHTVAYLTRDPAMLDIVKTGKSPHPVTGERIFGVSQDLIKIEDKVVGLLRDPEVIAELRATHVPDMLKVLFLPRTMSVRQASKKAVHGLNYAEGYKTFALMNEIEEREAKKIVELYSSVAYPGIKDWWRSIDATLTKTRTLRNCFGRVCYFMGAVNQDMFKQGYAFIPASTTVDCCNAGMVAWMEDDSEDFRAARLIVQGHDSLLFSYPPTDFAAMARFCVKLGREYMRSVLNYGEPYRLNTDLKVGQAWGRLTEVPLGDDPDALADKLRERWELLHERREAA